MATQNAVLMLVFNRPATTQRVLQAVRQAKPQRLYVAADGPRRGNLNDELQSKLVRQLFDNIDWPCEVHTRYLSENLGCRMAVSSAISWFFQNEDQGIILEDDTLPNDDFFVFCDEMLIRYKDDERIFSVSGSSLAQPWFKTSLTYVYSRYMCVWGWASWRRAWKCYDESMSDWPETKANMDALPLMPLGFSKLYWSLVFDLVYGRSIGTWDHQWVYTHWKHAGLSILPANNMVLNLGFGDGATHTSGAAPDYVQLMQHSKVGRPYFGPDRVADSQELGQVLSRHVHKVSFLAYLKLSVRKYPKVFRFLKKYVEHVRHWKINH